jgi:hypothetical protein
MTSITKKLAGFFPFIGGSKPEVRRLDQLDARPVRNSRVRWEKTDDEITLFIPLRRDDAKPGLLGKLFKMPDGERQIKLDEVGSSVWEMCDGDNDLHAIIAMLNRRYKLSKREAEASVREYMKTLAQRNLVGLIVGGPKRAKGK